nr:ribonuclease H-like domain-containing protein [Tanacetum cinerariifolium]
EWGAGCGVEGGGDVVVVLEAVATRGGEWHRGSYRSAGSESRPPMLNKENYVPWSSRLLRYAKSRPNEKLIHNSILNGPYVRRMIPEPGDAECDVNVNSQKGNLSRLKLMIKLFRPFFSVFLKTSMQSLIVVKLFRKSG